MGWKAGEEGWCVEFSAAAAGVPTTVHPLLGDAEEIGQCVHTVKQFMNTQP